jgi:hypothetical protein
MHIELKEKELEVLAELVFLGDWMINAVRLHKDQIKKYRRVCDLILKRFVNTLSVEEEDDIKNVDELHDYYMDELAEYRDYYANDILISTLAEELAEINYPLERDENFAVSMGIQIAAKQTYEDIFNEKGLGILKLDAPDFEERMAASREFWDTLHADSDMTPEERMEKAKALAEANREKLSKKTDSEKKAPEKKE